MNLTSDPSSEMLDTVLRIVEIGVAPLADLLKPQGLTVELITQGAPIPGSHWGDDEAGLIGHTLYVRLDTPVHSALHEASHWLLMDDTRRAVLHTDAGGSHQEEDAVCYLQVLLADFLPAFNRERMFSDMDAWGYSFRLGSAKRWFEEDAKEARLWVIQHQHRWMGWDLQLG